MAFQNLLLPIVSVFRSAGIQAARTALGGLGKDFDTFAKGAGQAAVAFGGLQALMSATQFVSQSVEMTQQYERNMLALKQIFENITPEMARFTKEAQASGIGQAQAAQASVFLGSVLKQYGLDVGAASTETQKLVTLAQDLATTYGYDLQEALLAMTALFRGEYDPIEKFGVAMKQQEINALLAARGQDKLTGSSLFLAQVQARLDLLYQRSADASGAFARANDTLYASQQKLNAGIQNLQVAFGEPLQKPLANITNQFADLATKVTPTLVSISDTLAVSLEGITPGLIAVVELLGSLLQLLIPVIATLGGLAAVLSLVVTPLANFLTNLIDLGSGVIRGVTEDLSQMNWQMDDLYKTLSPEFRKAWEDFWSGPIAFELGYQGSELERLVNLVVDFSYWVAGAKRDTFDYNSEQKRFELQAGRSADALEKMRKAGEDTTAGISAFAIGLKQLGIYATDAEGELTGLSGIFSDIAEDAAKSKANEQLELMGFNASQIEYFLTKPDWAQIFGEISRLAKIAALDIAKVNPFGTEYFEILAAQNRLKDLLKTEFSKTGTGTAEAAKKSVETIFDALSEETSKQRARLQLKQKGASEGLINLILGRDDWMSLWIQIKQGVISLEDLQKSFNKTADGAKELADATQEAADKAYNLWKAQFDLFVAEQEAIAEQVKQIRALGEELKKVSILDMLPSTEEIGKYEQSVVNQFTNIKQSIVDAFDNKAITAEGYNTLMDYARLEQSTLQAIARQRDDMANRYDLASALIKEYRSVFSTSLNLVSMLNQIEEKTKKVTVTETSTGIVTLSDSLKEFQVTLSKSYEETIKTSTAPAQAVLDGFRAMAEKARTFAANLKKLDEMGLDPMLFNQLVQAGVEAGGATAQALVDGGKDTITEVSDLFREIDALGGKLGEEVATGLYGDGINMANGLLDGLKSAMDGFEQAGLDLADAFTKGFNEKIDAAIEAAINKLNNLPNGQATGSITGSDSTGMPTVMVGGAANTPQMPQVIVTPAPSPVSTGGSTGGGVVATTTNVYASTFFGGYTAAQGYTASQSRIATNNGGISAFVNI